MSFGLFDGHFSGFGIEILHGFADVLDCGGTDLLDYCVGEILPDIIFEVMEEIVDVLGSRFEVHGLEGTIFPIVQELLTDDLGCAFCVVCFAVH
jgi:hypothetical protein